VSEDQPGPDPAAPTPASVVGDDLGLGLRLPGSGSVDDAGRRRTHPVTPLVHGASALPIGFAVIVAISFGALPALGISGLGALLLGAVVVPGVVAGWTYLGWRNTWYWFDEDGDFRVDSGILTKQQRRLQLSRLQSVDVAQPLFARVFSMAELTVEVAGSRDSRVRLQFLTLQEARALRSELLARAAGLRHDVGEAPEVSIVSVTPSDLGLSLLMRTSTAGLLLITALILVRGFLSGGLASVGLVFVTGGLPIVIVVNEFIRYFNFTVTQSPDGLRLRFGLARTQTRTVPPGRVQAIEFVEPMLWRPRGWVRLRVNIAGVGHEASEGEKGETLLLPVATKEVAADIVERVLPGLDLSAMEWLPAPERSRFRSPLQWRRLAVGADATVFATRRGRITRRTTVIPHARTQSVRLTQGPWERRLRLASVHVDSTPGPVRVSGPHLDAATARGVADAQAVRARQGRASDRSTRWAAEQ
jgi:putative membrane protein